MTEPRSATSVAVLLACALACEAAWGQPAPQPSAAASAVERAQRESDRTMYWIRVLADKPAPARAATAPKAVAAAAATPARPIAEEHEKIKAGAAPAPAAPKTVVEPAPRVVAQAASPVQSPAGDALYPTALSSSSADDAAAAVASAATPPPAEAAPTPAAEPDPGLVQVKSVQPDFPGAVVRRVHKGNVEVRFQVDPAGTVVEATVVESSHSRLNDAAVEAVRQWRFKPTPGPHTALVNLVFDIDAEI